MPQLSRHSVGTYQGNELTRSSSGNVRPQSFWLAEPLWTDPGFKRVSSVRELISTKKNFFLNAQAGIDSSKVLSQNPRRRGKSHNQ